MGSADASEVESQHARVSALFMGPRAENVTSLQGFFDTVIPDQVAARQAYYPEDPPAITASMISSDSFQEQMAKLGQEYPKLSAAMARYSMPFWSRRYAAHMTSEPSMPAALGWTMGTMYNQNNVTFEASPWTTVVEIEVAEQLCTLLGYNVRGPLETDQPRATGTLRSAKVDVPLYSWGHLTCDGTVANMESMIATRNLKFQSFAFREAMEIGGPLEFIAGTFCVENPKKETKLLSQMSSWELLNLNVDVVLGLPDDLQRLYGITSEFLADALEPYFVATTGKDVLLKKYGLFDTPPQYLIAGTRHYSWPKSAAISGIGSANLVDIAVDARARLDLVELRKALKVRLERQQAVYAVVAVIGTTEEGAVDDLQGIIALRDEFEQKGMTFAIHADAAWGGYFSTMLRSGMTSPGPVLGTPRQDPAFVPSACLRDETVLALLALQHADSVTIDPHKTGYIPYAAGSLCFRNEAMRLLMRWDGPYLGQGSVESPALYALEGSKAGASALSVFLHHEVVGLHQNGHGRVLAEAVFTSRMLSASFAVLPTTETEDSKYWVEPFNELPSQPVDIRQYIRDNIVDKTIEQVWEDQDAWNVLVQLGSETNINCFCCNFYYRDGDDWVLNSDVEEANYLNKRIYTRLTILEPQQKISDFPMFISATTFDVTAYGSCLVDFKERLKLESISPQSLFVLRNSVMSPFQVAGGFAQTLMASFESIVREELLYARERSEIRPHYHEFTMQGVSNIVLVYRPLFHMADSRVQLILEAQMESEEQLQTYRAYRYENPSQVCTLRTQQQEVLSQILESGSFKADILVDSNVLISGVTMTSLRTVKRRALDSAWRDASYPAQMPFYIYGTSSELHLDHMLLVAPNAQVSIDSVELQDSTLSTDQMANGLLLFVQNVRENTMQPFSLQRLQDTFKGDAEFQVTIYRDPYPATAHGPGLGNVSGETPIYSGTMRIFSSSSNFIDATNINTQDFAVMVPVSSRFLAPGARMHGRSVNKIANYTSTKMSRAAREMWKNEMHKYKGRDLIPSRDTEWCEYF